MFAYLLSGWASTPGRLLGLRDGKWHYIYTVYIFPKDTATRYRIEIQTKVILLSCDYLWKLGWKKFTIARSYYSL